VYVYGNRPKILHKNITKNKKLNKEKYSLLYKIVFDFKTAEFKFKKFRWTIISRLAACPFSKFPKTG